MTDEPATEPTGPLGPVTLAWLPAGDYEHAVTLWPDLAESELVAGSDGPLPHARYCRGMQRKLMEFAEAGFSRLAVPGGYAELLDTLAGPADPDHERMRDWVGNRLRPFDRDAVDARVRQVVGEVPESVRLLLDLVAR